MMKIYTLLLTLGTVLSSGVVEAHGGKHWQYGDEKPARMALPLKQLDLTAEQRMQIQRLRQQHQAANHAQSSQQLEQLLEAPQFDELNAKQLLADRAAQREQRQLAHLQFQHQVYQILSPQQRQQLHELRRQAAEKRQMDRSQHKPLGERQERKARQAVPAG